MNTIKVQLTGFEEAVEKVASVVIRQTIYDLEATIKEAMAQPKHGRLYPRGSRVHQASAPGEAPAIDTGNLIHSMEPQFPSPTKGVLAIFAEYAPYLEFGTRRMEARPFAQPAVEGLLEAFA
jgi:hypothetical protein